MTQLFVRHAHSRRARRVCGQPSARPATIRGHLWRAPAGYPALLLDEQGAEIVGEVLTMTNPGILSALDLIEGTSEGLYTQSRPALHTASGAEQAWVYVMSPLQLRQAGCAPPRRPTGVSSPAGADHPSTVFARGPVGESEAMARIREPSPRVGPSDLPVLITGESGTGKEVIARAVHESSHRRSRKLVVVDCAAITPTLMESELFGHIKGAFTGASSTTTGLAAEADGGTLFLDEIGEVPPSVQVKLLRLLEDGTYRSVGDTRSQRVNLRVLAATNRDLDAAMACGDFRPDLYHRLNGVRIHLPPLRDRVSDILPLANHFIDHLGRPDLRLSSEAQDRALGGNVAW